MAVTVLFLPDVATLKKRLRLTGIPSGGDAEGMLEEASLKARLGLYKHLGESLVATINGTAYTDAPATTVQLRRVKAAAAETVWVRLLLLSILPTATLDSANALLQAWNDEGTFRGMGPREREKEIERLKTELNELLMDLVTDTTATSPGVQVGEIGPQEGALPDLIGGTVFESRRRDVRI
jgi:hypothetical protein